MKEHTKKMAEKHRARAREKVACYDRGSVPPELALEVFLFDCLPRVDTYPAAHRLIERFGSVGGVFSASAEELMTVRGIGEKTARKIVETGRILDAAVIEAFTRHPIVGECDAFPLISWILKNAAVDTKAVVAFTGERIYLTHATSAAEDDESFVDFIKDAAARGAKYFIFAHAHPEGYPATLDDSVATHRLSEVAAACGAELVDHVVVTGSGIETVRNNGER